MADPNKLARKNCETRGDALRFRKPPANQNKRSCAALFFCALAVFFAAALTNELISIRRGQKFYAALPAEFFPPETKKNIPSDLNGNDFCKKDFNEKNSDEKISHGNISHEKIFNEKIFNEKISHENISNEKNFCEKNSNENFSHENISREKKFSPSVDFENLRTNFPDVAAWIKCGETALNYPIVRARDNDFYLHHFPDGKKNSMGSIFLDCRNAPDFSDKNVFIYGHSMRSGDMFGALKHYAHQDFFEKNREMKIFLPTQNFILKIFAGYVLDSRYEIPPMTFEDENHFENFVAEIKTRSIFESGDAPKFGDTLVFLCTCTREKNERLIIVGRLET